MAIANTAGSTPRRTSAIHQAPARGGSAFGRTPKNFHPLLSVRRRNTGQLRLNPSWFPAAVRNLVAKGGAGRSERNDGLEASPEHALEVERYRLGIHHLCQPR